MADPLIDSVVAHYQILSRLGGGAMGIVYQARDLKLGRLVALKFLPPEWSHDEDAKQRFVREAQAASSTDHVNICTVHDIQSTEDGRLFIVMAHYEGQTLKQRLAQGPLAVPEALAIAQQVADGLARAHAAGVVHRDIKPGNVIVTEDAVKIVDFGLATLAGSVQLTNAGSPMGTVSYMAPEQLRGLAATTQSDVWAVGAMLYEMLAGRPPFQGAYAEAVSYAIRHETPAPLRTIRPEVPEDVEQLVFRAMHKEPGVRFASGRELARALRQVQGHSVPLELQTAAIDVPRLHGARPRPDRTRLWTRLAAAAVVMAAIVGGATWYTMRSPPRRFVAIAPVVNATGDRTLDPYRLGLTLALSRELRESAGLRVPGHAQLLQPLRRFLAAGEDISGPEALQAIRSASGAPILVVPTLVYDRGAWKARAELQDASGSVTDRLETAPIESSLTKEAASTLITALADQIDARLGPRRWLAPRAAERPTRFQSLDAAQAFEAGINAYDAGEFAAARAAFAGAAKADPRHPLPAAWASRVAQIVGDRNGAAEAADRAEARLEGSSRSDRLFVQAVVAEARQGEQAEQLYTQLAELAPDDPWGRLELAAFLDRRAKIPEAIAAYRRVLDLDARSPGPPLELCRLYASTRVNDPVQARAFGERARSAFVALGSRVGEAQSLLCLSNVMRTGSPQERAQGRQLAQQALRAFESLDLPYNVGRAYSYLATSARAENDLKGSADALVKALENARQVGNTALEGTVLVNLGITYVSLGQRATALDYYRQSYETAERRGDERRAAYSRANAGALLIEYGTPPDEGLRFVEGALLVARRQAEHNLEVFCLQLMAVHDRFVGRAVEARRTLADAMKMARESGLADRLPSLLLEDGRTLMEMGEYVQARDALDKALASEGGARLAELHIELGRLRARMGDLDAARAALEEAKRMAEASAADVAPRLDAAFGERAYAAGLIKDARAHFDAASRKWVDEWPDAASVSARAYEGFIDGMDRRADGPRVVAASVEQASRMKRPALEAIARVLLARVDLQAGRPAQASAALGTVQMEGLSPELRAQVHYWRGEAHEAQNAGAGRADRQEAQRWFDEAQQRVPPELRERYLLRPELQAMSGLRKPVG